MIKEIKNKIKKDVKKDDLLIIMNNIVDKLDDKELLCLVNIISSYYDRIKDSKDNSDIVSTLIVLLSKNVDKNTLANIQSIINK